MTTGVTTTEVAARPRRPADWLIILGAAQVLLGGLVAAATGPLALSRGSWLAAYLVLVGGVAQYSMGRVASVHRTGNRMVRAQLLGWNAGNGAVMTGTLAAMPYLVDAGGLVLLAVLLILIRDALTATSRLERWPRAVHLALLVLLTVSVPVGLVMAHMRAG